MPSSNDYQRALELAQAGKLEEALVALQAHLRLHGQDDQALNDTGAVLYSLGRLDEAAEHLRKALAIHPAAAESMSNLAEVYLAAGKADAVLAMLDDFARADILDPEMINRVVLAFMDKHDHGQAIETMLRSQQLIAGQEALDAIIQRVRASRPRIAVIRGDSPPAGLDAILRFLQPRFDLRVVRGLQERQGEAFAEAIAWCQIVWFEGCGQELVAATRAENAARIICRVNSHDPWSQWFDQVLWERVACILVPSRGVADLIALRGAQWADKIRIVPCGLDINAIVPAPRQGGKRLACIDPLAPAANLPLLLQCLAALRRTGDWVLHFAGVFGDDASLEQYVMHMIDRLDLSSAVIFDGWQADLPAWLADKDRLVSAATSEGDVEALLAAMAAGVKPVVHEYPGADDLLPRPLLFATVDEFRRCVTEPYDLAAARRFLADRYPLAPQIAAVNDVLLDLERQMAARAQEADAAVPTRRGVSA